jgi:hypothetical protein
MIYWKHNICKEAIGMKRVRRDEILSALKELMKDSVNR